MTLDTTDFEQLGFMRHNEASTVHVPFSPK